MVFFGIMKGDLEDMGMLKSICLENYKCFQKLNDFETPNLTIMCGVNSSGKSSIINSLLLMKQSYEDNLISNSMKLNGNYVKCGRFNDISFKKGKNPITLKFTYELTNPQRYKRGNSKQSKYDITAFKNLTKMFSSIQINKFEISTSISIKKNETSNNVSDNILDQQIINIDIYGKDGSKTIAYIALKHLQNTQYVITLKNIPDGDTGKLSNMVELRDTACYFENFNLINAFSTDIKPKGTYVAGILANVYLIFKMNAMQFKNVHYLTPLRFYPQRNYILDTETDDVGMSGEYTPYIMHKFKDIELYGFVPPENDKIVESSRKTNFVSLVKQWMTYLQFGDYTLPESLETIQLNISNYNVSNVGFGVSQVLPIIVSGLIKSEKELLLLEQPEIHLHPSAQMCIADYLVSMAMSKRNLIVETHSDHIINRVVRRIMENPKLQNIVKIYFVEQNDAGISNISLITIDNEMGVVDAPEGFFSQFANETEKIIYTGLKNRLGKN